MAGPYEESPDGSLGPAIGPTGPGGPSPEAADHGSRWETSTIKALGSAFTVAAAVSLVLPGLFAPPGESSSDLERLVNLALAAAGAAVCVAGMLAPGTRRAAMLAGPTILVLAAAASPVRASLGRPRAIELACALAFAVAWLLTVEHMHALMRFGRLGAYASRMRLDDLDLGGVMRHFVAFGLAVAAIILAVTALVALALPWAIGMTSGAVLSRSAELPSVYGIAIASAVVFGLSAIILTLKGQIAPTTMEVERVAYSRGSMEEMLRGSRALGSMRDGGPEGLGGPVGGPVDDEEAQPRGVG